MNEGRAPSAREKRERQGRFTGRAKRQPGAFVSRIHLRLEHTMYTRLQHERSHLFCPRRHPAVRTVSPNGTRGGSGALIMWPDVPQPECVITAFLSGFHCVQGVPLFMFFLAGDVRRLTAAARRLEGQASVQLRSLHIVSGLPCFITATPPHLTLVSHMLGLLSFSFFLI